MGFDKTSTILHKYDPFWFLSVFSSTTVFWCLNLHFKWDHKWGWSLSGLVHAAVLYRRDWKIAKTLAENCCFKCRLLFSLALLHLLINHDFVFVGKLFTQLDVWLVCISVLSLDSLSDWFEVLYFWGLILYFNIIVLT